MPTKYNISSFDSSLYKNETTYISMSFSTSSVGLQSNFDGVSSSIELANSLNYNFDYNQNFAVSFYINAHTGSFSPIISKSQKKKVLVGSTFVYADTQNRYPFEINLENDELYFKRFDGSNLSQVSCSFTTSSLQHVLCQKSGSELQIWVTGSKIASASDASSFSTKNDALVFIGTDGNKTAFFTGSLSQIMIFANALTSSITVSNLSSSLDNSPNVGNVIYEHGMIIVTKPGSYQNFLLSGSADLYTVSFSSSIQTTEQRYKCRIEPDEFDFTYNPSTFDTDGNIKNTFTSSLSPLSTGSFSPYITTIGLHNENGDLIAVGKLGQPVRKSTKTPLNFIVKYDL
jgi:hypothetical protein